MFFAKTTIHEFNLNITRGGVLSLGQVKPINCNQILDQAAGEN